MMTLLQNKLAALRSQILKPQPKLTLVEFADTYRRLGSNSSAPGPWRTSSVEPARQVMLAVSNPNVRKVSCVGPTQLLKTELLLNAAFYFTKQEPSPILIVCPREEDATMWATERLQTAINSSPEWKSLIRSNRERDSGNKILQKTYLNGATTAIVSARAPASLASRPVKVVLYDETDKFVATAEGSAIELAEKRTTTFFDSKVIAVCSPTKEGESIIWNRFLEGSQHVYHQQCPYCEAFFAPTFKDVVYPKASPKEALLKCSACEKVLTEADRQQAIRNGKYVASFPERTEHMSFHVNSLSSPWVLPSTIAEEYERSKDDLDKLQVWTNTLMANVWSPPSKERLNYETLQERVESYEAPPPEACLKTMGVDVQKNRIEASLYAWTQDGSSFLSNHWIIHGETHLEAPWEKLKNIIQEQNPHFTLVDSGYLSSKVYQFCQTFPPSKLAPSKGKDSVSQSFFISKYELQQQPNTQYKQRLFIVGSSYLKDSIFAKLKLKETASPGFIHFNQQPEDFFKGIASEELIMTKSKWVWQKHYPQNEPLDCLVYATAAFSYLNSQMSNNDWLHIQGKQSTKILKPQPNVQTKRPQPQSGHQKFTGKRRF